MVLDEFVRLSEEREQTAIVHLINPGIGTGVDLVAVNHIGIPRYYAALRTRLTEDDVVLYEGANSRAAFFENYARAETRRQNRMIDEIMTNLSRDYPAEKSTWLEIGERLKATSMLVGQTEGIDYDNLPGNWIMSDLSPEELTEGLGIRSLLQLLCYESAGKLAFLPAWFGGGRIREWSARALADFSSSDEANAKNREREEVIYENLGKVERGVGINRISIFYGAEHMPFIKRRLVERGYVKDMGKPAEYLTFSLSFKEALWEISSDHL